jgi:hypothetical protein
MPALYLFISYTNVSASGLPLPELKPVDTVILVRRGGSNGMSNYIILIRRGDDNVRVEVHHILGRSNIFNTSP